MIDGRTTRLATVGLLVALFSAPGGAEEGIQWDQGRITVLAGELHHGVNGLRDRVRSRKRDLGSMQASSFYRLLDRLRLIESETRLLHHALEAGSNREETLPTYARIALLRRDCAEEMRRLFLDAASLERIARARSIVQQMDAYYGFDPTRPDHDRVLRR